MTRFGNACVGGVLGTMLATGAIGCLPRERANDHEFSGGEGMDPGGIAPALGVPNGALEQPDPIHADAPFAWRRGGWGVNAPVFRYPAPGRDGTRAAGLTMTSRESGDAKWYFEPQLVTAGTRYLFSDVYAADTASIVVVQLTLTDGKLQNLSLVPAPPAPAFTLLRRTFMAPPGASRATVFHGLATVGSLSIDDVSLLPAPPVASVRGVANGDLEQEEYPGATTPAAFRPNAWGQNDARFTYSAEGHSGRRSVRVDMTTHTDGTAAWYFDEQPVGDARAFLFEAFYRASVDVTPQARVWLRDGTTQNLGLPRALRAEGWTRYAMPLWLPEDAIAFTVLPLLAEPGYVQTDDYGLHPYETAAFRRGVVSLTFDDGWRSDYETTLPILERHGARGTFYVLSERLNDPARVSLAMLADMRGHGHEIAAHTAQHRALPTLSDAELEQELALPKRTLESAALGPVSSFASPYGAYDARTLGRLPAFYRSHRTVDAGYNTKSDFDPLRLRVQSVRATTSVAQLTAWAARAAADRSWLILVYHEVADPSDGAYAITSASFDTQMTALASSGLPFLTVSQALDELLPQR